jgi:hypothetical protein
VSRSFFRRRNIARRACPSQGIDEGAPDCTTQRHKTHIPESGEVHYRWHPLYGRKVLIRREAHRRGVTAAHCVFEEEPRRACLEIPKWMFDRARCSMMCLSDAPHVSWASLVEVHTLLDETARPREVENRRHFSETKEGAEGNGTCIPVDRVTSAVGVAARSPAMGDASPFHTCRSFSDNVEDAARVPDACECARRGGEL